MAWQIVIPILALGGLALAGRRRSGSSSSGSSTTASGQADGIQTFDDWLSVDKIPVNHPGGSDWKGYETPRAIGDVNTVVVHQTAVKGGFGVAAYQLAAAHGDVQKARRVRYRDTPYHGVYSPRDRSSVVQWPPSFTTWHGHGSNRYSVAWSYDGLLPGDQLDVAGARASLRHFVRSMRGAGVPLRYIEAHRQHSKNRGADPGVEIWTKVVRPLLGELGLQERPYHTTGTGYPLPAEWRK